jgi:hypothetical protein
MKLTFKQIIGKQRELIALKKQEIELLEELLSKPEIIGSVRSIEYINRRLEINMKQVKLEVEVEQNGLI